MSISTEKLFTITAAFDIVKSAVRQAAPSESKNVDTIIFNSLHKAIKSKVNK